jgi:hypothetical protein
MSLQCHVCLFGLPFDCLKLQLCKAGCKNDGIQKLREERIICTPHRLTLPEQLSLLLFSNLAEHILVKLRVQLLSNDVEQNLSETQVKQIRSDVRLLMTAAGQSISALDEKEDTLTWLGLFSVATDLSKCSSPGRANPKDLGLLRDKAYAQPVQKALSVVKTEPNSNKLPTDGMSTESTTNANTTSTSGIMSL